MATPHRLERAAMAAGYVFVTMLLLGLSESFAWHRVAIEFGAWNVLHVACSASLFALVASLASLASDQLKPPPRAVHHLVVAGAWVSACGYIFFAPDAKPLFALMSALLVAMCWRIVGDRPGRGAWLWFGLPAGFAVYWLVRHYPFVDTPWLFGMAWAVVLAVSLIAHAMVAPLGDRARRAGTVTLVVLAAAIALAAPWVLPTHYCALKIFGTATCAFAGAGLLWTVQPRGLPRPASTAVTIALAAALIGFGVLASRGRTAAYGAYPVDSVVGKTLQPLFPTVDAEAVETARRAALEPRVVACPTEPKPSRVLWVVADALRADAFDSLKTDAVERLRGESTLFTNAYAPAQATYNSFAAWFPRRPDEAQIPWKFLNVGPYRQHIETVLGSDAPIIDIGPNCSSEGARIREMLGEFPPGSLAMAYMPVAHAPYLCEGSESVQACYERALACLEEELAPLIEFAEANPDWALILTADHGESFGEKHLSDHNAAPWQETIRVPLVVRAPGWSAGEVTTPVSSVWLSNTIGCWLADDPAALRHADGLLADQMAPAPFAARGFSVYFRPARWAARETALIDGTWKLILDYDTGYVQLFDLATDPAETNNVADSQAERVATMRRILESEWPAPLTKHSVSSRHY